MGKRELIAKRVRELEARAAAGQPANASAPSIVVRSRQDLQKLQAARRASIEKHRQRSRQELKSRRPQRRK